jgi:hypothetical protein
MATIHITFESRTTESDEQGDLADHGWTAPNEQEISLVRDCRGRSLQDVARASRIKRAQQGKFRWTLRDAVRFMLDKRLDSMRFTGVADNGLQVDSQDDQDEYHPGNSQRWTLHIKASAGTLDRLARVLEGQGCRAEWRPWKPTLRPHLTASVPAGWGSAG